MRHRILAALLAAAACKSSPAPAPSPGPTPVPVADRPAAPPADAPETPARKLESDTPVKTTGGTTFTASAGWWITERPDRILLEDPERELRLFLLEQGETERAAAVAAAWKRTVPGFALAVAQDQELPARDGWDAVGQIVYVTATEESRVVVALARRKGKTWQVALLDGKLAALGRRGAQLGAIIESVRMPGMAKESFAGRTLRLDGDRMTDFGAFVDQARTLARVPGVAVAVVHAGKIIFEKGYGVRALGGVQAVTPDTRFMIGSTTKSLTTLMMARLVDRGTFTWDTPVTQVLPSFALADEAIARSVTIRHTVCACTGMPRQDLEFVFEFGGWDPERRMASLAGMKPTTGFGETFQYSNLMVSTGGYAAAHALAPKKKLGPAYDAAMQELVFAPLGMNNTTFDYARARRGNAAAPHAQGFTLDYTAIPIVHEEAIVPVRPAGAAWSTARDLAAYVMLELGRGKLPDGKQLVTEENLLRRRQPQVKITDESAYGLGLFIERAQEIAVVGHGGNTFGFTADLFFLPDHDVGVVVLTNAAGANSFTGAVRRRFFELVFDGKPEAEEDLTAAMARAEKSLAEERALLRAEPDPAWISPLLGRYLDPSLGTLHLYRDGKRIVVDAGEWKSDATEKVDRDGVHKLVLTSAPLAGTELVPRGGALVLDAGQQVYEFTRAEK